MFSLTQLSDLLRIAAVIALAAVWLWRYSPWRKRRSDKPDPPAFSAEVELVTAGVVGVANLYQQTRLRREHLLWAILSTPGEQLDGVLGRLPLDRLQARARVATIISGFPKQFMGRVYHRRLWLSRELQQTLSQGRREAVQAHAEQIAPLHLLLALMDPDPAPATEEAGLAQKLSIELGLTRAAFARIIFAGDQDSAQDAETNH
jgi:ATP-dependent Clp protease ATP-binding subunit ClpA